MYSANKLNKQGDNTQPWRTPFPIWNQFVVPCPVLTVASWPAYRFLKRQLRWSGIPISFRIFHSLLWSTQWNITEQLMREETWLQHGLIFVKSPSKSASTATTKIPQTRELKQQIFIPHIYEDWEIQNQGANPMPPVSCPPGLKTVAFWMCTHLAFPWTSSWTGRKAWNLPLISEDPIVRAHPHDLISTQFPPKDSIS